MPAASTRPTPGATGSSCSRRGSRGGRLPLEAGGVAGGDGHDGARLAALVRAIAVKLWPLLLSVTVSHSRRPFSTFPLSGESALAVWIIGREHGPVVQPDTFRRVNAAVGGEERDLRGGASARELHAVAPEVDRRVGRGRLGHEFVAVEIGVCRPRTAAEAELPGPAVDAGWVRGQPRRGDTPGTGRASGGCAGRRDRLFLLGRRSAGALVVVLLPFA